MCGTLAVQGFARAMGLTPAESNVLEQLCSGLEPTEIARANRVGIATVRTQIGAIRNKVGARSIRDLQRRIASLPPMVSALRHASLAQRLAA
jgi:DNA-binding CsgD family transcriptional regulator